MAEPLVTLLSKTSMPRSQAGSSSHRSAEVAITKAATRRRVTDLELHYVVEFLEVPSNYNIIVGKATKGRGVIGGQPLTKTQGGSMDLSLSLS